MRKYKKTEHLTSPIWKVILCFHFLFLITVKSAHGNIDSLQHILKNATKDSVKLEVLFQIGAYYQAIPQLDSAKFYYNQYLQNAPETDRNYKRAIKNNAITHYLLSDYESSTLLFTQLMQLAEENEDSTTLASAYNGLGIVIMEAGTRTSDTAKYYQSLDYHSKALNVKKALNMTGHDLAITYNNMANALGLLRKYSEAAEFYEKSLALYKESGDRLSMAGTLENMANVYDLDSSFAKAEAYFLQSVAIYKSLNDTLGIIKSSNNLLEHKIATGKLDGVKPMIFRNQRLANKFGLRRDEVFGYSLLVMYFEKKQQYDSALYNYKRFVKLNDTIFNQANQEAIAEMKEKYETAKKEHALEISNLKVIQQKAIIHRGNVILYSIIFVLLIVLIFSYFLYKNVQAKKTANEQLKLKNELVEEQNEEITSSIQYARKIQEAILPSEEYFNQHLKDAFVLYSPKDIVSGDFYWMEERNGLIFFAVVDCTGHCVPGAFMSMVGYNGLNKAINELNLTNPGDILDALHEFVYDSLHHNKENTLKEGMDLALCCYNPETMKLSYAGAYNSLFVVTKSTEGASLKEIKANKQPVGSYKKNRDEHFINHELQMTQNDTIYLTSDGFLDQFGGPDNKKFMRKRFHQLIMEINQHPIKSQKEIFRTKFINWKGNNEQTDDICVLGFQPQASKTT